MKPGDLVNPPVPWGKVMLFVVIVLIGSILIFVLIDFVNQTGPFAK